MSKLKVAELFYSIQGEGKYMGVPSVFLRTFGCNFQCSGFGMPAGKLSKELEPILAKKDEYKEYGHLPLVSTGCDSYASWHSDFKHLSPMRNTDELAEDIVCLLPYKEWRKEHLVITGGEPLLGWQRAYPDLLEQDRMHNLRFLTFETNGTQELSPEFKHYLQEWHTGQDNVGFGFPREVTFSVSAKLSCSGELRKDAIKPEIVASYQDVGDVYLKYVITSEHDALEALEVTKLYIDAGFTGEVYFMPVGGVESVYSLNNRRVADLAMKYGLRYSDRLQVPLFKNAWGT